MSEWISVDERLPGIGHEEVLIAVNGYVMIGVYVGDNEWMEPEMVRFIENDVTHWMSLPEPPKEN